MNSILNKLEAKTLKHSAAVSAVMVCLLSGSGWAMLAPARIAAPADSAAPGRAADIKAVQTALESKVIADRLKSFGLNKEEIDSRLGKLSDQQVHKLAGDIKTLSPGGGIIHVLEIVVLVLLILLLI